MRLYVFILHTNLKSRGFVAMASAIRRVCHTGRPVFVRRMTHVRWNAIPPLERSELGDSVNFKTEEDSARMTAPGDETIHPASRSCGTPVLWLLLESREPAHDQTGRTSLEYLGAAMPLQRLYGCYTLPTILPSTTPFPIFRPLAAPNFHLLLHLWLPHCRVRVQTRIPRVTATRNVALGTCTPGDTLHESSAAHHVFCLAVCPLVCLCQHLRTVSRPLLEILEISFHVCTSSCIIWFLTCAVLFWLRLSF